MFPIAAFLGDNLYPIEDYNKIKISLEKIALRPNKVLKNNKNIRIQYQVVPIKIHDSTLMAACQEILDVEHGRHLK